MDPNQFRTFIAEERKRIIAAKNTVREEIKEIREQISALDREMIAVYAYEKAIGGNKTRGHADSRKRSIVEYIQANPGAKRRAVCEHLGIDSRSNQAQTVTNLLSFLVKSGEIIRKEGTRSYYPA